MSYKRKKRGSFYDTPCRPTSYAAEFELPRGLGLNPPSYFFHYNALSDYVLQFAGDQEIALAQAIPPIVTHFSIARSVCLSACLSSVYHIRAPCLNRSTDLHARGPCSKRQIVTDEGLWPSEERKIKASNFSKTCNCTLPLPPEEQKQCFQLRPGTRVFVYTVRGINAHHVTDLSTWPGLMTWRYRLDATAWQWRADGRKF